MNKLLNRVGREVSFLGYMDELRHFLKSYRKKRKILGPSKLREELLKKNSEFMTELKNVDQNDNLARMEFNAKWKVQLVSHRGKGLFFDDTKYYSAAYVMHPNLLPMLTGEYSEDALVIVLPTTISLEAANRFLKEHLKKEKNLVNLGDSEDEQNQKIDYLVKFYDLRKNSGKTYDEIAFTLHKEHHNSSKKLKSIAATYTRTYSNLEKMVSPLPDLD